MESNTDQNSPKYLIIPAAGLGTRMRGVHPDLPKELLPVGHKPAIQYAVEEGLSAGITNIAIIISTKKEIIRDYFEDGRFSERVFPFANKELEVIRNECSINFLYQKEPLGESDAISYAAEIAGSHPVAIIHPDDIYFPAPGVLKELKSVYQKYGTDVIALMELNEENADGIGNSGRVDIERLNGNVFRIKKFIEKGPGRFIPRFSGEIRSCGISISGPHIFEYIERLRNNIKTEEFTNLPVMELTLQEKGFLGCHVQGNFFDVGNPVGYELCLRYAKKQTAAGEQKLL